MAESSLALLCQVFVQARKKKRACKLTVSSSSSVVVSCCCWVSPSHHFFSLLFLLEHSSAEVFPAAKLFLTHYPSWALELRMKRRAKSDLFPSFRSDEDVQGKGVESPPASWRSWKEQMLVALRGGIIMLW